MGVAKPDRLIINSPWREPAEHWLYDRKTQSFRREPGRRPAGCRTASRDSKSFDDPGIFVPIPLVNHIRPRVKAWREADWPGVTGVTRKLLEHWNDEERDETRRLFFCQIEAAETFIWWTEGPETERTGLDVEGDGGPFPRLCAKMATGTGKTVVMAMLAAWQILNRVAAPRDNRFSRDILVIAPGLTVKDRLAVLDPNRKDDNYYEQFDIVPPGLFEKLRRGRVVIHNWHALNWETDEKIRRKRGVDKRGALGDRAYARKALGKEMKDARNILVFNDEAHHAWRVPEGVKVRGAAKEIEEATRWIGGLDRIHQARRILAAYDFSATPFTPAGNPEESLFKWIVSDFGLDDAIESGLVKTPRIVIRSDAVPDAKTYKPKLYHIYPEVKDDLNQRDPQLPLPQLVSNAYHLLGIDWRETLKEWKARRSERPPVMITVANRTETAARVKHAFDDGRIPIQELCDPDRTLHIDSRVLEKAESGDAAKGRQGESLREQVNTVGQPGKPGGEIRSVISVDMLSEGWDAKNVTHIMGLRAFSSQLLCEQVVGRGLRRISYDINPKTGLFDPEYVNIFGVPFSFLPHEEGPDVPKPEKSRTDIHPVDARKSFGISWPNVIRIERGYRPRLSVEWDALPPLELDASRISRLVEMAPTIAGKPNLLEIKEIDLRNLEREFRIQRLAFVNARDLYRDLGRRWSGGKANLMGQLVRLMEQFMERGVVIKPDLFQEDPMRRRVVLALNMTTMFHHIRDAIRYQNVERLAPVFDSDRPILSTGLMRKWATAKPSGETKRCHINRCVYDSTWEQAAAVALDRAPGVEAWVKNDHLGFEILYAHDGIVRKYRPDFLVRFASGAMLVLEIKGEERERDKAKHRALEEWTRAVNEHGGFGTWSCAVSRSPDDIHGILARHAKTRTA